MTLFNRYTLFSLIIHVLLIILLFIGAWLAPESDSGMKRVVQAVIIDPNAIERQAQSIREVNAAAAKQEADRLAKEKEQKIEQEKARQEQIEKDREAVIAEEKKEKEQREAEIQRKVEEQKKAEEQKKKEAERLAKEQAERQKQQQQKQEAERLAKEKAEQQKKEEQKKKEEQRKKEEQQKLAQEKAQQQKQESVKTSNNGEIDDLFADIDVDDTKQIPNGGVPNAPATGKNDLGSATEKRVLSELDKMKATYELLIKNNLRDSASFKGKKCQLSFKLTPVGNKGLVNSPKSLGGDSRLCSESISALGRIKEFPLHSDPAVVKYLLTNQLEVKL